MSNLAKFHVIAQLLLLMQLQRPKPNQYKFEELMMKKLFALAVVTLFVTVAAAKIPAPVLSDEAKLKAAETAAKTAWSGKKESFLLCQWQDKSAAHYRKTAANAKPAVATPPCADPGAFVFPVPEAAATAAAPATPAVAAAAAKPAAPAAKAAPAVVAAPAKKS
jgi:hypothetical protein